MGGSGGRVIAPDAHTPTPTNYHCVIEKEGVSGVCLSFRDTNNNSAGKQPVSSLLLHAVRHLVLV